MHVMKLIIQNLILWDDYVKSRSSNNYDERAKLLWRSLIRLGSKACASSTLSCKFSNFLVLGSVAKKLHANK